MSERNVEIMPNSLDDNLFDAYIVATVGAFGIDTHDVMTCDVRLADGAFEDRVEKSILEKNGEYKKK